MTIGHVTIFEPLEPVHIFKDVGQFAAAFAKLDPSAPRSTILHNGSDEISVPSALKHLLRTRSISSYWRLGFFWNVLNVVYREKARSVTIYHAKPEHLILAALLRLMGQRVYLKLDLSQQAADSWDLLWQRRFRPKNWVVKNLLSFPHVLSCEGVDVFKKLKRHPQVSRRLLLVPNGMLDEAVPEGPNPARNDVIVVVARMGSEQKNCEMILDAMETLPPGSLGRWQLHFCGPATSEFQSRFCHLLDKRKDLITVMHLKGELGRDQLFEVYRLAKVFLLTSRFEGFSLASVEAAWSGCYVASTPVTGMSQLTNDWRFGHRLDNENVGGLVQFLKALTQNKIAGVDDVEQRQRYVQANFSLEQHASKILKLLAPAGHSA